MTAFRNETGVSGNPIGTGAPMHVMWLTENFPPSMGGVQQYLGNTILNMASCKARIVTKENLGRSTECSDEKFHAAGHKLYRVADWPQVTDATAVYRSWWPLLKMWAKCHRIIRAEAVSLVVMGQVSFFLLLLTVFLKVFTRVPVAFIFHGEEIPVIPLKSNGLRRVLTRMADLHVCNSRFTEDTLTTFCGQLRQTVIAHPGVEEKFFEPTDVSALRQKYRLDGRKVIYTVGRLDLRKGHDLVIEALPWLIERMPEIIYLIGGTGRNLEPLKQIVREKGLEEHVLFCGFVPDEEIIAFHQAGDLFVMPNRTLEDGDTEGFGIVFLEANACGKPVIGGASGGAFDAVADGVTGFLIDPRSIEELSGKIACLLSDPALAARMGEAGRQRAWQHFRWPVVARQLEEWFLQVAAAPRSA